ncbi:molybdenum cofactor guanylyltransferase [Pseudogemmobacter sonorensis]|uniref:molybdenum cofactor guanylyltransferase n=1 Tax=Pseudogemmobacter sonorensis TaxID=2989681 RepID=UPI003F664E99
MADGDRVIGVVLAGGQARRMGGAEKGLLTLDGTGTRLIDLVLSRLGPQCEGLVLNANGDPARLAGLGLPVVPDDLPDFPGPLAGVLAGMEHAAGQGASHILTAAADTPFLPLDLRARLEAALAAMPGGARIALAATGDRDLSGAIPGAEGAGKRDPVGADRGAVGAGSAAPGPGRAEARGAEPDGLERSGPERDGPEKDGPGREEAKPGGPRPGRAGPKRFPGAGARLAPHPTFGLWPVALRHDLRAALARGERRVRAWAEGHGVALAAFAPHGFDPFFNVNTPGDLAEARRIFAALSEARARADGAGAAG